MRTIPISLYPELDAPIVGIPHNLPRCSDTFVGRDDELIQIKDQLQQGDRIAITAIAGMGGIGKTELALQYAYFHLEQATYAGGICWLRARESEVGSQLVLFARHHLKLKVPEDGDLPEQIRFCWQHWRPGTVLIILDDVTDYALIQPYLPPSEPRFQVLITTRLQLGTAVRPLELSVLSETAALDLLRSLTSAERIDRQRVEAQHLCDWLGYLPLGLQLVGRYLAQKPDLLLYQMRDRLQKQRLQQRALVRDPKDSTWNLTAQQGVAAAFELSWQELDAAAQELCYLLSLFALAPIAWQWIEQCFPDREPEALEDLRDEQLIRFSLLQRSGEQTYRLHQLIREFFQAKSQANIPELEGLKRSLCQVMAQIARTVPQTPTLTDIAHLTPAIPHLESTAQTLLDFYNDEDVFWAFTGVAWFYQGQGQYSQAEPLLLRSLDVCERQLGSEHPSVATSLNNLAYLYYSQGRYSEAEPLYLRSLDIRERQLGSEHPDVATSLNNLAYLYYSQGRYSEAEPRYLRSLAIRERQLGADHPDVAQSLNNLANLYKSQGRYSEAEPLYLQALAILFNRLGESHPNTQTGWQNFVSFVQQVMQAGQVEQLSDHPMTQDLLRQMQERA